MILATIIGNLGRDAEIKTINDKQYLSFSVASTEKNGEQETTTWVSVLASNNPNLLPFLRKGQQVFVQGRLKAGIYQSNNSFGIDLSVFAQTLQLCGGKKEDPAPVSSSPSAVPSSPAPAGSPSVTPPAQEEPKDDLPF